jgi:EAL domain-containing protein (putative c-di-GMP-specific phosphodiesterase class I)
VPIGSWVLDTACRQLAEWLAGEVDPSDEFRLMVNLSVRQLDSSRFGREVAAALARHGIEPERLCFELTESALAAENGAATEVLRELRALGCGLAIDDFGTGYSMLSNLKRFPFDTLKVDRSFIAGLGRDAEDEAIVAAIVGIARALDLAVVGEGIEDAVQAAVLAEHGIEFGQGYLFGAPCGPRELLDRLRGV